MKVFYAEDDQMMQKMMKQMSRFGSPKIPGGIPLGLS